MAVPGEQRCREQRGIIGIDEVGPKAHGGGHDPGAALKLCQTRVQSPHSQTWQRQTWVPMPGKGTVLA